MRNTSTNIPTRPLPPRPFTKQPRGVALSSTFTSPTTKARNPATPKRAPWLWPKKSHRSTRKRTGQPALPALSFTCSKAFQPTETRCNSLPIYQAIILAIIQGLAEFIPISSSGHLIVVRRLLGWNELSPAHELTFDVALHAGTLISVLAYFWRTWIQIIRAALGGKVVRFSESGNTGRDLTPEESRRERLLLWFLVVATIPGGIAGKLLEHSAEDYFRSHL